jgi:hypothetical protein
MSTFMNDHKDYLAFAVQLHRFCNAPMPPHYTLELLRTLWWIPPADTTSTWTWRVDRLARLMMLANRRAVWHRYQLGRQQDHKEPRQHRSTKLGPLKPAHRYHHSPMQNWWRCTNSPAAPCTSRANGAGALSKPLGERCDAPFHHPDSDKLTTEFNRPDSPAYRR